MGNGEGNMTHGVFVTVDTLLRQHFPGSETELHGGTPEERLNGFLIWPGFADDDQVDRQKKVWQFLRAELPGESQRAVSAILTVTPEELAAMREGV